MPCSSLVISSTGGMSCIASLIFSLTTRAEPCHCCGQCRRLINQSEKNSFDIILVPSQTIPGPAVSDKGRYIPRYKLSCHKQVSDTQNVWNCHNPHKHVLNNKTVWNCGTTYFMSIKMLKKLSTLFSLSWSHLIVLSSMYELLINNIPLFQLSYHIHKS